MSNLSVEQILEVTRRTIETAEFCFLVTLGRSAPPTARLMQPFSPEKDFTVWMGVHQDSRKVHEIEENPEATLAYDHAADGAYVALMGRAELVTDLDKRRHYWTESFAQFWPGGPESESYALIRFVPSRIEVMNMAQEVAPPPFGLRPVILVRREGAWHAEN